MFHSQYTILLMNKTKNNLLDKNTSSTNIFSRLLSYSIEKLIRVPKWVKGSFKKNFKRFKKIIFNKLKKKT